MMWYSFFFKIDIDVQEETVGPITLLPRSWRQQIPAFVAQKTPNLDTRGRETLKFSKRILCTYLGQVTRVKRFGGFLLPLAKIIGAELLPVFESWGCSRKYVIFNLFLSAVSAVFFMVVAFRCNLKSVSNLLYHGPFQHRKSERRSQQMLVALMKNLMAIEKKNVRI